MYDSDKPNVEVSVTVMLDFTFSIVVHNRNLPSTHEILRKNSRTLKSEFQFVQLLERIGKYVACIGNPEEMAHRSYTDYSAFISAFQEPDLGAKNSILRYHSTIRSNSCHLLIRPPEESLCNTLSDDQAKDCYRCDECSRIRSQVLSMRGLFSLLDGSKVPDTDSARKKRLQLLRDFTTKEVLANRVDILETQIKRYQQLLPDKFLSIEPVIPVSDGLTTLPESLPECNTAQQSMPDNTTQYVTSISESVQDGEVQNVIRVTLADASSENADITSDVDVVYHDMVVPAASSSDDIILVTGEDSMPPTERLLEELASGSLTNT
ncbi:hypothetical protein EB796_005310 [Bugula neritina]|uniref:Uncharacterized protein n=1 Tax=Bugula neritina TaxID=10212 RepID=A0A7J7KFG7_BUGNE|nr:hypothetical protein EB796_005310 [Bugula neritina]